MTSSNPAQLFLLADHIKLSLLERQRAIALNLVPNSADQNISRSLQNLCDGLESAEAELARLVEADDATATALRDQIDKLRNQYTSLLAQFKSYTSAPTTTTTAISNDAAFVDDFSATNNATNKPQAHPPTSSLLRRTAGTATPTKIVRFSDNPLAPASGNLDDEDDNLDAARAHLFPYRDHPSEDGPPDQSGFTNQQIHDYHHRVLAEQDEQLNELGNSVSRQRELSIQIGSELDDHVQLLDEVDTHVGRHENRLAGARRSLGVVARKAKKNGQVTIIIILILVLLLLIIVLE